MEAIVTLSIFAKEINKTWTSEYSAKIRWGKLEVSHNHVIVAIVDKNFDIEMVEDGFGEVEDQLIYMIGR